jgi:hypothetical protein
MQVSYNDSLPYQHLVEPPVETEPPKENEIFSGVYGTEIEKCQTSNVCQIFEDMVDPSKLNDDLVNLTTEERQENEKKQEFIKKTREYVRRAAAYSVGAVLAKLKFYPTDDEERAVNYIIRSQMDNIATLLLMGAELKE